MKQAMEPSKSASAGSEATMGTPPSGNIPQLPVWKAFVVQFSRDTDAERGTFSGRVEHLSSGRRAHFHAPEELLAILRALLDEIGETPLDRV